MYEDDGYHHFNTDENNDQMNWSAVWTVATILAILLATTFPAPLNILAIVAIIVAYGLVLRNLPRK
jgi:hypothetical protein